MMTFSLPVFIVDETLIHASFGEMTLWMGTTPILSTFEDSIGFMDLAGVAHQLLIAQNAGLDHDIKPVISVINMPPALLASVVVDSDNEMLSLLHLEKMPESEVQRLIDDHSYNDDDILTAIKKRDQSIENAIANTPLRYEYSKGDGQGLVLITTEQKT
jgi:hypothetical protein